MYLRYYGFKEMPFNITPDPRFLYLSIYFYYSFII